MSDIGPRPLPVSRRLALRLPIHRDLAGVLALASEDARAQLLALLEEVAVSAWTTAQQRPLDGVSNQHVRSELDMVEQRGPVAGPAVTLSFILEPERPGSDEGHAARMLGNALWAIHERRRDTFLGEDTWLLREAESALVLLQQRHGRPFRRPERF